MKKITLFLMLISISFLASAQNSTTLQEAFLDKNGRPAIREIPVPMSEEQLEYSKGEWTPQAPGWPKTFKRNTFYYPYRGLTLADLNNDGKDEIIFSANKILYAYEGDGTLLWQRQLLKDSNFPPAVADVTGNGNLEVVVIAHDYYFSTVGHVYVVDNTGQILPGWPVNITVSDKSSSPALADLDNNGQMEIIFGSQNMVQILKADGTPFSSNWPVQLDGNSAFTVSVGDINNDGQLNIIAGSEYGTLYAFNLQGQILPGYPVSKENTEFYWNSPMLVDFDNTGELCIVGALGGAAHEIYARNHNGEYRDGWPRTTHPQGPNYDNSEWTATEYALPVIADINCDGNREVFCWGDQFAPTGSGLSNVYGLTKDGNDLPNFPFSTNGNYGFTSVADLDGDGQFELITPGGTTDMIGGSPHGGYIYAFKADGSQVPGFPLRPKGWLAYTGINLGDVTGDGMLDLVALGQIGQFTFQDSIAINVISTDIPMADANIQFGTYKGSNTRTGLFEASPFKDVAPGAVANFNVTPAPLGVLQATLTWNNPALQVNGSPLTELNQVKIFRDSVEIATINNPVIGAEQTFIDNTIQENGFSNYRIFGVNNAGKGVNSYAQCYIGQDVPAAPGNVVLTTNLSNAIISWEAPSAGLNGGYFTGDNITYTVTRIIRTGFYGLPDEHVVAENITGLQVAENEVETGRWSYRVTASNNIGEGGSATSNFELLAPDSILMFEAFNYDHWKLPPGWDFVGDHELAWQVSAFNVAGGLAPPELRILLWPENIGVSWMKTYPVDITGASHLKFNFKQRLENQTVDQGEIIGLDVTYDDGLTWDVIWEKAIGTESIPATEYEFYYSVPDGATSMKLGFRFQGNNANIYTWEIDDVIITDVTDLNEVNFIIVEDSDEMLPVAGAKVAVSGNEYFADENGHVLVYLPSGTTHIAVVSANGYVTQEVEIIVGEDNQTVVVKLMDVLTAPYDLHITTEGLEDGQALLGWNGFGPDYEFRHDDGTASSALGSNTGTLNTVLGSAYRYNALLEEMSWFLTNDGGPHNSVKIWVFGLNSSGIPDPTRILFQQVVSNIDMQWNTFQFATPIEAPDGFYLGISYAGYAALALDTGTDPQWPFQPNSHFVAGDYMSGFQAIDGLAQRNFLIRAVGTNYGELRSETNAEPHPAIHDVEFSSVKPDKPFEAGNPQYAGFNRSFTGFNVYLDDLATPVAENISAINYMFTNLDTGSYVAGVQAVYSTGVSEIVTVEFQMVELYSVTFVVEDEDGNAITDAIITFDGEELPVGDYVVENVIPGNYDYTIRKTGYFDVDGQIEVVNQDLEIEVTLIADGVFVGEAEVASFRIYPNPAKDKITLTGITERTEIRIYNVFGEQVLFEITNSTHEINLSLLKEGTYIVKITTEHGRDIHKLIVK